MEQYYRAAPKMTISNIAESFLIYKILNKNIKLTMDKLISIGPLAMHALSK